MAQCRIWYIPTASHTEKVFTAEVFEQFLSRFEVTLNDTGKGPTTEQVAEGISGYDGLVTGWGSCPPLTVQVLEAADRLRIIAHSAGSVKGMLIA